jgi:hypothetical protein
MTAKGVTHTARIGQNIKSCQQYFLSSTSDYTTSHALIRLGRVSLPASFTVIANPVKPIFSYFHF